MVFLSFFWFFFLLAVLQRILLYQMQWCFSFHILFFSSNIFIGNYYLHKKRKRSAGILEPRIHDPFLIPVHAVLCQCWMCGNENDVTPQAILPNLNQKRFLWLLLCLTCEQQPNKLLQVEIGNLSNIYPRVRKLNIHWVQN